MDAIDRVLLRLQWRLSGVNTAGHSLEGEMSRIYAFP